jgi:hypothetical protein
MARCLSHRSETSASAWSIAAVERDCGRTQDARRVWQRRNGFPQPGRDGRGQRLADQIDSLRLCRRLTDPGHRPGRVIGVATEDPPRLAGAQPRTARRLKRRREMADNPRTVSVRIPR